MNYKSRYSLKVAIFLSWGLALLLILLIIGPERIMDSYSSLSPNGIRDFVSSFGLLSAIIYVFLHAIRSFVFLPVTPLTIAGGYLFGTFAGLALTFAGRTIISATITFYLSRYLLRDYVKRKIRDRYAGWDRRLEKEGIFYVILMRIIPMFPFDAVGYVAGASGIKFKKYLAGTIIGDLPGVLLWTVLGSSLSEPGSIQLYLSMAIALVAIAISGLYFKLFMSKRDREKHDVRQT